MSIKKDIRVLCRKILQVKPDPDTFGTWRELAELAESYKAPVIRGAFEAWATEQKEINYDAYTRLGKWPVSEFLRVADVWCSDNSPATKRSPALAALLDDLVGVAKGAVVWDAQNARGVEKLLGSYPPAEILAAFKDYWKSIEDDKFQVQWAARKFGEVAEQLIRLARRNQADAERTAAITEQATAAGRAQSEAEIARMEEAERAEREAVEGCEEL